MTDETPDLETTDDAEGHYGKIGVVDDEPSPETDDTEGHNFKI